MANHIADIQPLEDLLKKRFRDGPGGRVQIGAFWSVLQIYKCLKSLGISISTICAIASMVDGRVDSSYNKTTKPINTMMIRKHLHLEAVPRQISHTVVTKEVARGSTDATKNLIGETLLKYNSYGQDILKELCEVIDNGRGELLSSRATTMGFSDFSAVLAVALLLIDMYQNNYLKELEGAKNSQHKDIIIKKIKEYQKENDTISQIGFIL